MDTPDSTNALPTTAPAAEKDDASIASIARQAIVDDAGQTNEAIEVRDKYMGDFIGEGDWYGQL